MPESRTSPDAPRRRILLVDDEPHIVDVVPDYVLREQGFEVTAVASAELALTALQRAAPHLVILDLGLPGLPGLELLRHLRTSHPALPVIILSARSEEMRPRARARTGRR